MVEQKFEKVGRSSNPELDSILGRCYPVLDDGFVRLIDYMGSDAAIVQAARVSYGAGTKAVHDDAGLINYLMRHRHTTPFEMCEIKFHVRVPMDCWRQWIRHRTANVNEYSTRYSEAIDAMQKTMPDRWRLQSKSNKQGSVGFVRSDAGELLTKQEDDFHKQARLMYKTRLLYGVAREQARKDLPLSNYTEAYWKIDLHNLLHFLSLRLDPHAQEEIRAYADVMGNIAKLWCPAAWKAFETYRLDALSLSGREKQVLKHIVSGGPAFDLAREYGWIDEKNRPVTNRERAEFEEKLAFFGLTAPWGKV